MTRSIIYGFAFQLKNIGTRTLYRLENIDLRYLLWGKSSMDRYLRILMKDQPDYILGLGIYTGKGKNILHLESECSSKFGKLPAGCELEVLSIKPFLKPRGCLVLSSSIGSSYCNLVSYRIMELINNDKLKSKYSFIHIPKEYDTKTAVYTINAALSDYFNSETF